LTPLEDVYPIPDAETRGRTAASSASLEAHGWRRSSPGREPQEVARYECAAGEPALADLLQAGKLVLGTSGRRNHVCQHQCLGPVNAASSPTRRAVSYILP
jgi:hypothetical protein